MKKDVGAFRAGVGDAKGLQAFTEKMAGKGRAMPQKAKRSRMAAPNPPTPNENTVVGGDTKIPAPAKSRGRGGMVVNITFGKDC